MSSGYYDSIDPKYMFYFKEENSEENTKKYFNMVAKDIENLDRNYVSCYNLNDYPEFALEINDVNKEIIFDKQGCDNTCGEAYSINHFLGAGTADVTGKIIVGEKSFWYDNTNKKYITNGKNGCLQINVLYKDNNGWDGASLFPVFYLISYKTSDIKSTEDYCFIHGKFYQFKDLEDLKVFEDEKYTIYNINQFLFTDPEQYIRDYMFNVKKGEEERYYQRALNVYNYFNENINDCFEYYYFEKPDEN